MGRIKTVLVKRTAKELLAKQSDLLSDSFEINKKLLTGIIPSKKIRNQVAGYIARLKKKEKQES